jgi:DNA ligase (NAD+)
MTNNIKILEDKILEAKKHYYEGNPIMSDDDYDLLENQLKLLDPSNRVLRMTGSDIKDKNSWPLTKLTEPMGSLNKVKSYQEFESWFQKYKHINAFFNPKGDGGSIQLTYQNGKLIQAVTRGNGYEGEDILSNVLKMKNVKANISDKRLIVLKGELLILNDDFKKLNKIKFYANPRNAAAGISKNKNAENVEFVTILYYAMSIDGKNVVISKLQDEINKLGNLRHIGIHHISKLKEMYYKLIDERDYFGFDIDGLVIKTDEDPIMKGNCPVNYMALKFPAKSEVATIDTITFERSRTGRVVPVAKLKNPVYLSGAQVQNVSLGSWDLMHQKKFYPGSIVEVIRANDVIPFVKSLRDGSNAVKVTIDDVKKSINDNTLYVEGAHLKSKKRDNNSIVYDVKYILVDVLEYKNFSGSSILDIVEHFKLKEAYEFFDINPDELLNVDGWGQSKVDNLKLQMKDKNKVDIKMFIKCLSIENFGSSRIAKVCNTLNIKDFYDLYDVQTAGRKITFKFTAADLMKANAIQETLAKSYVKEFIEKAEIAYQLSRRLTIETSGSQQNVSNILNNLNFCITGKTSVSRKILEKMITENGGNNTSINKANFLLTNDTDSGTTPQQNKQVRVCQKHKKYHQNRSGLCPVE